MGGVLTQPPTMSCHAEIKKGEGLEGIPSFSWGGLPLFNSLLLIISTGRTAFWPSKLAVTNSTTTRRPLGSRWS